MQLNIIIKNTDGQIVDELVIEARSDMRVDDLVAALLRQGVLTGGEDANYVVEANVPKNKKLDAQLFDLQTLVIRQELPDVKIVSRKTH